MKLKEIIETKQTKNNFTKNDFNKILQRIKKEIKDNKDLIEKTDQIDRQNSPKMQKIEIDKLLKNIDKYTDTTPIKERENKTIITSYYGDPYITIELCIKSIIANNKIILAIEDFRLGLNKIIVEIFNKVLKERKINNNIFICNLISKSEIKENIENIDKIICIGNKNTYTNLKKIPKVEYYPYNNIELYCDSDELTELQNKLYEYAIENNIEIEIYDDEYNIDKSIELINKYGEGFCAVLLTKSKENVEKFRQKVKTRYICINENPYNKYNFKIPVEKLL